jgi:hypothetical protein
MLLKLALGVVSVVHIGLSGLSPVSAASSNLYDPHQQTTLNCIEESCTLIQTRTLEWAAPPTSKKIPEPGMVTAIILSGLGIVSTQKRRAQAQN